MIRRQFITLLGGAAAWPLAARAQQTKLMKHVGALFGSSENDGEFAPVAAFREALAKLGWVEGRDLRLDLRFGGGNSGRLRAYAEELVQLAPDVLVAGGNIAARAVLQQTRTIPIVFVGAGAVVESPTVKDITHPEGNITGFANKDVSIEGKWLELLKEVAPDIARVAFIYSDVMDATNFRREMATVEKAAQVLHVKAISIPFHDAEAVERSVDSFALEPGGGLIVNSNIIANREFILRSAARNHLPLISAHKSYPGDGGLMSYGSDFPTLYQGAARYVDRILRGAKPGELPVQLPTKYDLVINLKTARSLGLTIPPSLLAIADEVIE